MKAKKGQFCVVERIYRSTYTNFHSTTRSAWLPAIVRSCSRDGIVKSVELCGGRVVRNWHRDGILGFNQCAPDSANKIDNPSSLLQRICGDDPYREFNSLADAVAEIKRLEGF